MKINISPRSAVDLKVLLGAVPEDVIVIEWAEQVKGNNFVYLVNTSNTIGDFDKFEGVILHPDPSSVNYVRGTTVSEDNIFAYNDAPTSVNVIAYIS